MLPALLALSTVASSTATPYLENLIAEAAARGLADSLTWRRLVHYEPRWIGDGFESTADTERFFLADEGKTDPHAELRATLAAFFAPPVEETKEVQHPQCRFRARYRWLRAELGFDDAQLPVMPCARFEWWRERLNAKSATVVFAAAYLNNPASMFGHTFLRLNRTDTGQATDLVAYTVNYAAIPTTNNPLFYTVMGLAGGFYGMYSTMPYYMKVKEYSDLEKRDLWEYDLSLSEPEIERLVEHLWELGQVSFDYFYFDENCSYHLLSLLEAARPTLELTSQFGPYVIPADTLRVVVEEPGLVTTRRYRHSRYVEMLAMRGRLNPREVVLAEAIASGADPIDVELPKDRHALVLDAALALNRYRSAEDEDAPKDIAQQILITRGRLRVPRATLEIEEGDPPELSHESTHLALGAGADASAFVSLELRFALHDLFGLANGYVRGSQIEFLRTQLRVPVEPTRGFEPAIEMVRLLRIVSLTPYDAWVFRPSWRLSTGVERLHQDGCVGSSCLYYDLSGGPGLSAEPTDKLLLYAFLDASGGAGPAFEKNYRVALGASVGALLTPFDPIRLGVEASYRYPLLGQPYPDFAPGDDGAPFTIRGVAAVNLTTNVELRGTYDRRRGYEAADAQVRFFF